ncbi:hypothetical protein F5B20DRAFT_554574 [Whalleya microplaca]|nr:hypothetical protein F5B20DRAFT_554574 [Whalleya microplaca]
MSATTMERKKSFATTESTPVDATFLDLDPPFGRCTTTGPSAGSSTMRRRSQSSQRSESTSQASSPCASRELLGGDCARQRFIVWAAVKRNKSVRIPATERLKCPLLRCGEHFEEHEMMLRHLTQCQHLSTAEYVCYECMKVERFNDGKCRCCLDHPKKRRRIINMAKNFFSNIGHKSRREGPQASFQDDLSMPPPSYDSVVIDVHEQNEQQQRQQQQEHEQQPLPPPSQPQPQLELNGREILELDSRPLVPTAQLDSVNYDPQPADVPMFSSSCNDMPENSVATQMETFTNQEMSPLHAGRRSSNTPFHAMPLSSRGNLPSLALNTHIDSYRNNSHTKFLSPSSSHPCSSHPSTRSSHGVSPISPWSSSSGTMSSSIYTTMTSPATPFRTNEFPPMSQPEHSFVKGKDTTNCPEDPFNYTFNNTPELPGDDPLSMAIPRALSDPLFFSCDPKDNFSWMSSVGTELSLGTSVNMMFTDPSSHPSNMASELLETPGSSAETKALVVSAWDALQEHISSSLSKLAQIKGNPLAERLRTQTPKAVALTGLSVLKNILVGHDHADPLDYICFIHLIYAFSLVIHEDELATRCNKLYKQALAYRNFLNPAYLQNYTEIVTTVWQPTRDEQIQNQATTSPSRGPSMKGKEPEYRSGSTADVQVDPLVSMGQNFLDDLENSIVNGNPHKPIEVLTSELYSTHIAELHPQSTKHSPFAIAVTFIIQVLSQKFHDYEDLLLKLKTVEQRVNAGHISSIRQLELAILQAGKDSLGSFDLCDEFIPQVRHLCDPIYTEQGFYPRTRYQTLGVSLVEALIQSIAPESEHVQGDTGAFPLNLPDTAYDDFEFLTNLPGTFEDHIGDDFLVMNTGASQQNQPEPGTTTITTTTATASNFDPIVDPTNFQRIPSSAQISTTTSKSYTTTASHTDTPSETFAASPDLSRAPPAVPSPSTATATPARDNTGGSEKAAASASSSSKVEANDCCEICGYRPKGDPQWFKGSMAKHKKMQHSAGPPVIYRCPFPGCNSQYKNRQDNLRQHQIEKNHFVGDEAGRRPSKRKKVSTD